MRARTYGLLLLALVGVIPLVAYGLWAIGSAQTTAAGAVLAGNQRLAQTIAERIRVYAEAEQRVVEAIGAAALQASDVRATKILLDAYTLQFPKLLSLEVRDASGRLVTRSTDTGVASQGVGHVIAVDRPVFVAGREVGAVRARVDLVHLWDAVNEVQVGATGRIRLITGDGTILAHGDPEERRDVYDDGKVNETFVAEALAGGVLTNQRGEEVVGAAARVPGFDWLVVVEHPTEEAFAGVRGMKRSLVAAAAVALIGVVLLGILFGRIMVRGLEQLRAHTAVLGRGELKARVTPDGRLVEVRDLAVALNEMAASLDALQEQARQRERLSTFARVAAGLAHDLRLPIEAVRGAYEGVRKNPQDQRAIELMDRVSQRELPRLSRYVDDLRGLARRGRLELDIHSVAPHELAQEVVDELAQSPKWRGITFSCLGSAAPAQVDRNLVRRALINLASNAADACTEQRGGNVTIEVGETDDGKAVYFRVVDDGPGIAPERVEEVVSGDFKSTKRSTGVGLGLGVVRQVAQSHGGTLTLSSEVGTGSTFTLSVPRASHSGDEATSVGEAQKGSTRYEKAREIHAS